jgi:hypothetical protein
MDTITGGEADGLRGDQGDDTLNGGLGTTASAAALVTNQIEGGPVVVCLGSSAPTATTRSPRSTAMRR